MNKKILLLLPALAMVLAGCNSKKNNSSSSGAPTSSSADPNAVTAVEVTPASKTVEAGETVQLEASVKPFTAANKEVTWSSDNETLATVNASGLVTTYEAGTVHIKATSQADTSKSGQSTLTINVAKVYYPEKTPDTEKTYKFGTYQKALSKRIFFNGEFEDYPRGKTAEGYDNGVDVKFENGPSAGQYYVSYTVGGVKKYLGMSEKHRFGSYEDHSSAETVWTWDAELKTVKRTCNDPSGTYFPGTYNNYETISGCDINQVSSDYIFQFIQRLDPVDPTSVTLVEHTANVYANGSVQLHAECEPAGAMNAKLTWTVEGNEKVHVDNTGFVTADADAVPNSHATIKATFGELPGDACDVTVKERLNYGTLESPLTVAQAKALIDLGQPTEEPLFVKGVVTSSGAYSTTYNNWDPIWLASDDGTVEKAFEGYRLKDGSSDDSFKTTYAAANSLYGKTVTISGIGKLYNTTYETDGGDESKLLKVEDIPVAATGISLNPNTAFELTQGEEKAVKATLTPYGATATVDWTVSPSGQGVTYEDGKVKATDTATTDSYTLTASVHGADPAINASVTFTVVAPSAGDVVADFTGKTAGTNQYNTVWTYGSYTIAGGSNNNKAWAYLKMGGKQATVEAADYKGTYIATNTALTVSVRKVTVKFIAQCYNNDNEKATVHVEAYSDSALTAKVAETASAEVAAIGSGGDPINQDFSFSTPTAANLYYKVVFDIYNKTTYNGVVALETVTFVANA